MSSEYLSRINAGKLKPEILPSGGSLNFEKGSFILSAPDNRKRDCWESVLRFNPQENAKELAKIFRQKLEETGFPDGTVGYFPVGISTKGQAVWEKFEYFNEPFHNQLMAASSWKLIPDDARKVLNNNMSYYGVGLSVGSALVEVATRMGVKKFTLADPDTTDSVGSERQVWSDPHYNGWNKTVVAQFQILKRNPYAKVTLFKDGLNKDNAQSFFGEITDTDRIHLIAEETDSAAAKNLARLAPRRILADLKHRPEVVWAMIADVGPSELVVTVDQFDDQPYNGRVARIDPQGDLYGVNLPNIQMLFASIGGIDSIPSTSSLLPVLTQGLIGKEIRTVPQAFGAVLLAQAVMYELLIKVASGKSKELSPSCSISLKSLL